MTDGLIVASLPASHLHSLADLRRETGLRVLLRGDWAWLRWDGGDSSLTHRLMALPNVEIFRKGEDGHWRNPGRRLPVFDLPINDPGFVTLVHAITPLPCEPIAPPPLDGLAPHWLSLVRDGRERPATALLCSLDLLAPWIDSATSGEFESLSVALCGDAVLLRGKAAMLPAVAGVEPEGRSPRRGLGSGGTTAGGFALPARPQPPRHGPVDALSLGVQRFWGVRLLVPLGWRPHPDLPERAILRSLRGDGDDVILIHPSGTFEAIPLDSFAPWSRASARMVMAKIGGSARS